MGWNDAGLRVMTYNVFADRPDFTAAERIVQQARPDVVFLQEVTKIWEPTLEAMREHYPYQNSTADDIGLGNVLLSRLPLKQVKHLPARYGWHGAWFAVVRTPVGPVQLLGVHLTPPLTRNARFTLGALLATGPIHRREIEAFCSGIDFESPLIILGDFNENERGAATTWLLQRGLQCSLEQFDLISPTWVWVESPLVTARLDHIFHSGHLQLCHAQVVRGGVSDHQPVVAAFRAADFLGPVHDSEADRSLQQADSDHRAASHARQGEAEVCNDTFGFCSFQSAYRRPKVSAQYK